MALNPFLRIAFACFGLLALPVSATTLPELLQHALDLQPVTAGWQQQAGQLDAEAEDAARLFPSAPTLSLSGHSDQWHDHVGQREWEVELEAPLWRIGQRRQQQQLAKSARTLWQAEQQLLQLVLAGRLRKTLWDVEENSARLELARQRKQLADALALDVNRRLQAGELAKVDALLVQADVLAAQNEVLASQQQQLVARTRLHQLTGQQKSPTQLQEEAATIPANWQEQHPRLLAALQQHHRAQAQADAASTGTLQPSAALSWKQEREFRQDDYVQTLGLKLSVPLGANGRNRANLAAARAAASTSQQTLQQIRHELEQTLALAQRSLALTEQQWHLAQQQDHLAQQNLQLSRRAFDAGERDLLSLLKLQNNALDAHEKHVLGRIAYYRAIADFNQALGVLP